MKKFADREVHREIKIGNNVLLRRDKLANKQAPFDPSPYRVTKVKENMVNAERNQKNVTRNIFFFKKIDKSKQLIHRQPMNQLDQKETNSLKNV